MFLCSEMSKFITVFTKHTQILSTYLLLISLNMGTGELAINTWKNNVTGITYLKNNSLVS